MCDDFITKYKVEYPLWKEKCEGLPLMKDEDLKEIYEVVNIFYYFPIMKDRPVKADKLKKYMKNEENVH